MAAANRALARPGQGWRRSAILATSRQPTVWAVTGSPFTWRRIRRTPAPRSPATGATVWTPRRLPGRTGSHRASASDRAPSSRTSATRLIRIPAAASPRGQPEGAGSEAGRQGVREGAPAHLNRPSSAPAWRRAGRADPVSSSSSGTWPRRDRPAAFTLSAEIAVPRGARITQAPRRRRSVAPSPRPTTRARSRRAARAFGPVTARVALEGRIGVIGGEVGVAQSGPIGAGPRRGRPRELRGARAQRHQRPRPSRPRAGAGERRVGPSPLNARIRTRRGAGAADPAAGGSGADGAGGGGPATEDLGGFDRAPPGRWSPRGAASTVGALRADVGGGDGLGPSVRLRLTRPRVCAAPGSWGWSAPLACPASRARAVDGARSRLAPAPARSSRTRTPRPTPGEAARAAEQAGQCGHPGRRTRPRRRRAWRRSPNGSASGLPSAPTTAGTTGAPRQAAQAGRCVLLSGHPGTQFGCRDSSRPTGNPRGSGPRCARRGGGVLPAIVVRRSWQRRRTGNTSSS